MKSLKQLWSDLKIFEIPSKRPWNTIQTPLKHAWNTSLFDKSHAKTQVWGFGYTYISFLLSVIFVKLTNLEKAASGASALVDILLEIPLFWGHIQSNNPYFWLRIKEEELRMENSGWIKEIWGMRMENRGFRIQN